LPLSWKKLLTRSLRKHWAEKPGKTVVLVGVGNLLMGDDAAGMLVVQNLKASLPADSYLIPVEGGPAPENCTGLIRRLNPGMVIFIDAGEMAAAPGEISFVESAASQGISAFGHALPLSVLGQYLETEIGCKSYLLVVQPECIDFDIPVSLIIGNAVNDITETLLAALLPD
jgi:hydrogenase 3 maturation protease